MSKKKIYIYIYIYKLNRGIIIKLSFFFKLNIILFKKYYENDLAIDLKSI
jgi:hypothetical protein